MGGNLSFIGFKGGGLSEDELALQCGSYISGHSRERGMAYSF